MDSRTEQTLTLYSKTYWGNCWQGSDSSKAWARPNVLKPGQMGSSLPPPWSFSFERPCTSRFKSLPVSCRSIYAAGKLRGAGIGGPDKPPGDHLCQDLRDEDEKHPLTSHEIHWPPYLWPWPHHHHMVQETHIMHISATVYTICIKVDNCCCYIDY
jgi:hypothetical protein